MGAVRFSVVTPIQPKHNYLSCTYYEQDVQMRELAWELEVRWGVMETTSLEQMWFKAWRTSWIKAPDLLAPLISLFFTGAKSKSLGARGEVAASALAAWRSGKLRKPAAPALRPRSGSWSPFEGKKQILKNKLPIILSPSQTISQSIFSSSVIVLKQ